MKKTYLAAAVAAVFSVAGVAQAQDYQMEAGLSYVDTDMLGGEEIISVDFTYHLETVTTANRPLKEAAFLGNNSNISASVSQFDTADVTGFNLGGEFWMEQLYLSADLTDVDGNQDYEARIGFMLQDGLLLNAGFADGDTYLDPSILVAAKYVAKMGENFVNLEAELETNDGDNAITLVGDYFFTPEFAAGLRIVETDVTGVDTAFGVGASYFFTPVASVEVEYMDQDGDATMGLRAAMRF
ncbi:MAG: putative porin [Marinobacter sp.]|nr:putative porin [Marinobacter sp.]